MTFTVANIVTLIRLFLAPIFLVSIVTATPLGVSIAVVVFIVAALTDWLDGFLARKYGEVTDHGIFLDPLADKVLTTSAFVALYLIDVAPLWMVIVIVVRDFGTTAMRSIADDRGMLMKTSAVAKVKTFLQMCFIGYALVLYWVVVFFPAEDQPIDAKSILYSDLTYVLVLAITVLTLMTAVHYFIVNKRLFLNGSKTRP